LKRVMRWKPFLHLVVDLKSNTEINFLSIFWWAR
jgi:hypothetical protein